MSRRTDKNVGVIGLGIIGRRVAECLRRRGFHTFVWNRTPRPFPNFVGSPSEIVELCDFVQIFVSDDDALIEMVQQMKPSLNPHHIVMAHSTVAPHTMRAAAEIVHRRGAQLLDAPFTGSKGAAEKGELVYYIGGDDAAYRRARSVLEASSKEIIEIGEIGQATTIKLATNMITAATVQAAAEALALVHSSGLSLDKFQTAMRGNGSNSGTLTMKLPKMIGGDFEPHFSVKHMLKDVEIASRLARSYGRTFAVTEVARDSLVEEARQGRSDQDYSSIVHTFFPDGPPRKGWNDSDAEAQGSLSGLDERPLESRHENAPETETTEEPRETAIQEVDQSVAETPRENSGEDQRAGEVVEALLPEEGTNVNENSEAESVRPQETLTVSEEKEPAEPRGFFARMFGKGSDY